MGFGFFNSCFSIWIGISNLCPQTYACFAAVKKLIFKQLVWSTQGAPKVKDVDGGLEHELENVNASDTK